MSQKSRKSKKHSHEVQEAVPETNRKRRIIGYALVSIVSLAAGSAAAMLINSPRQPVAPPIAVQAEAPGQRSVAQLITLSDAELEQVDIVEMNIAVARGIPGLEKLDYDHYRSTVDKWTDQFRLLLAAKEFDFRKNPERFKNDINFFRLGLLAEFLDYHVGVAYVENQKQALKRGLKSISYTDPGHLMLHGLIDTKRGTCATMPTLHVAIGRRMGWPVSVSCAKSHFICRYDDGEVVYNIESTDTGRGGFAAPTDQEYIDRQGVSPRAIACGSDLKILTARQMLSCLQ